jgi:PAP2 superfamily
MTQSSKRPRARRWLSAPIAIAVIGATMLIPAASVSAAEPADMVLEWNTNAINAIANAPTADPPGLGQVPPLAGVHLAMVHGAIYDAVNSIDDTRQPYLVNINAPAGASRAAAVAQAAHDVLVGIVPASLPQVKTSLDSLLGISLGKITPGASRNHGVAVGAAAARAMLANRVGDGRANTSRTFPIGTEPGEWRPVPPLNTNVFSWIGDVRPFSLNAGSQFRVRPDPPLQSAQYTAEFNEVKALGGQVGSTRNAAQEALANFIVVNPFSPVNTAFREIATAKGLSTSQQARLFAMTSLSSADAFIDCWNNKNRYLSWRPQTAIQLAATDGNPYTVPDPNWIAKFPNPGYPDNPSGYNCFAASMMTAGSAFFGTDNVAFQVRNSASTRSYTQFSAYVKDAIEGRILIGFHFRHADVNGAWLGKTVATWVAAHEFKLLD